MRAVPTRAALRDITAATGAFGEESWRVARAFMAALDDAANKLGRYPELGSERREIADPPIRFWPLNRFRYVVVYDSAMRPPQILRVLHGARDLPQILSDLRSD